MYSSACHGYVPQGDELEIACSHETATASHSQRLRCTSAAGGVGNLNRNG